MKLLNTLLTSDDHRVVFLRFAAVGGFFTLIYMIVATLLATALYWPPAVANFVAHVINIPPTYLSQRALAFRSNAAHATAFWRYVALQAPLVLMSTSVAWLLIDQLKMGEGVAFVVIGVLIAVASFVMQRFWAFARRRD